MLFRIKFFSLVQASVISFAFSTDTHSAAISIAQHFHFAFFSTSAFANHVNVTLFDFIFNFRLLTL